MENVDSNAGKVKLLARRMRKAVRLLTEHCDYPVDVKYTEIIMSVPLSSEMSAIHSKWYRAPGEKR